MTKFLWIGLFLLIPSLAFLGNSSVGWTMTSLENLTLTEKSVSDPKAMKKKEKKWSASLYGDMSVSVNTPNDESRKLTSNLIASFRYQLPYKFLASFSTGVNKDYRGERKLYLINSYASLIRPLYQYQNWARVSGTVRLYLPTNKHAYHGRSLRSRLSMSPRLDIDLSQVQGIRLKHTTLSITTSYTHDFYRFKTPYLGKSYIEINTRHAFSNTLGISYAGIPRLFLSASFGNTHRWSTRGERKPDTFAMSQEASYQVTPSSFFTLGRGIGGTTFKDDGVTSNIEFFNPNKSYVYTSWTYRL